MKNLIYLASTILLVLFCLTSCQKEELVGNDQIVASKKPLAAASIGGQLSTGAGPQVLIAKFEDDVLFDCCEYSEYTMDDVTHNFYINTHNKKYSVTFSKNGKIIVKHTTQKTFRKYWADGGIHNVEIKIVNPDGSYAGATSPNYQYLNTDSPPCIVC